MKGSDGGKSKDGDQKEEREIWKMEGTSEREREREMQKGKKQNMHIRKERRKEIEEGEANEMGWTNGMKE